MALSLYVVSPFFVLIPISICLRALCYSVVIKGRYKHMNSKEEWMRHENNDVEFLPSQTFEKQTILLNTVYLFEGKFFIQGWIVKYRK